MGRPTPGSPEASALKDSVLAREEVFGELARALAPRAIPRLRSELDGPNPFDPEDLEIAYRSSALPAAAEAAIAGSTLRITEEPASGRARLRGSAEELARLTRDDASPALRVLLRAHRNATRPPGPPGLMGILNLTPDSFSDGGRYASPEAALAQARAMAEAGASFLDVGGESTRPGSAGVSEAEELGRILPVIEGLRGSGLPPISVDTTKAGVAEAALARGAAMINDVSAGRLDPRMLPTIAANDSDFVLMHMLGTPRDMQERPRYEDVVGEVTEHLRQRAAACLAQGIAPERLWVDPGIGFGKRLVDNLSLIRGLAQLRSLGLRVVLGLSRKRFLGELAGTEEAAERDLESVAAQSIGLFFGADLIRVHDVAAAARGLRVAGALRSGA